MDEYGCTCSHTSIHLYIWVYESQLIDPSTSPWSFFTVDFLVMGVLESFLCGHQLYTVKIPSIHRVVTDTAPVTGGDMGMNHCFLSYSLSQRELLSSVLTMMW